MTSIALRRDQHFHRSCKRYFFDDIFLGIKDTARTSQANSPDDKKAQESQAKKTRALSPGGSSKKTKMSKQLTEVPATRKVKKTSTCSKSGKQQAKKTKETHKKTTAQSTETIVAAADLTQTVNLNPRVRLSCICKYFTGKGSNKNVFYGTCRIKVNIDVICSSTEQESSSSSSSSAPAAVSMATESAIKVETAEADSTCNDEAEASTSTTITTDDLNVQNETSKNSPLPISSKVGSRPRTHHYRICHFGKDKGAGMLRAYNFRSSTVVNHCTSHPIPDAPQQDTEYSRFERQQKEKASKHHWDKHSQRGGCLKMRMRSRGTDDSCSSSATDNWRKGNRSPLLVGTSSRYAHAMKNLLRDMSTDEISRAVTHDDLVIAYGLHLFAKYANVAVGKRKRNTHIATRMRQLGRLLSQLQAVSHSARPVRLADHIRPVRFKGLLRAIRDLCGFVAERSEFKRRFLAIQLGQAVRQCAAIIRTAAAQAGDEQRRADADSFLTLCRRQKTLQSLGETRVI